MGFRLLGAVRYTAGGEGFLCLSPPGSDIIRELLPLIWFERKGLECLMFKQYRYHRVC